MDGRPLVSVIIPMLDEEEHIEACLKAISAQDYPHELLELIVVDGGSSDRSAEIVETWLKTCSIRRQRFLRNEGSGTPSSLNLGLEAADGDVIVRVDSRSVIPSRYVTEVVRILAQDPHLMGVGGAQVARAGPGAALVARAIARALRNPYLTGFSRYRRRDSSGPSDTVYLGAYRRADLVRIGGWDERFFTNQDYELNQRLRRSGTIWFEESLAVEYRPRTTFGQLFLQYRRFGRWKAAGWLEDRSISARHQLMLASATFAAGAFVLVAKTHPKSTAALSGLALLIAEASVREPGGPPLRVASAVASGASIAAWFVGIYEQAARFACGERLLTENRTISGN